MSVPNEPIVVFGSEFGSDNSGAELSLPSQWN